MIQRDSLPKYDINCLYLNRYTAPIHVWRFNLRRMRHHLYQGWAQMEDTMTVLTPDTDLSTDLMFVTPELTEEQQLVKLSVIVSSEETDSLYLNGDKLNVSVNSYKKLKVCT